MSHPVCMAWGGVYLYFLLQLFLLFIHGFYINIGIDTIPAANHSINNTSYE